MAEAMRTASNSTGTQYQITVKGRVSESWSDWLQGVEIASYMGSDGNPVTVLSGAMADQAALRGLVTKLWDLNATLIAVQQITGAKEHDPLA